jgi:hypothetical protein
MKNSILAFGFIALLMSSCGNATADGESDSESAELAVPSNATCIYDYMDKYDQLLTLDTIKKHYTGDMSKAEFKYEKSSNLSGQETDKALYSWESGRTYQMKIMGMEIEVPIPYEIGLKWLGSDLFMIKGLPTPKENFEQFYRNVTKEEAGAAMGKAKEQVVKEGKATTEQAAQAGSMADGLSSYNNHEKVSGVGEAAAWVISESHLVVLVGDKIFQIAANTGDDKETNKKLAIALAQEVIRKCK